MSQQKLSTEEKVKRVLEGLEAGRTRDELAKSLGYKDWRGIDVLMRRRGYICNDGMYLLPEQKKQCTQEPFVPQPVRIVLDQLQSGSRDLVDIAAKAGFRDRKDLTVYMKSQGWLWSSEMRTYIKDGSTPTPKETEVSQSVTKDDSFEPERTVTEQGGLRASSLEDFLPLLNFLQEHQGELEELLNSSPATSQIPHYKFPSGVTITKSFTMGMNLDQLVRDFSAETGVTQRVIVEAALIQFMEKYGYARQVMKLLEG